MSELYKETAELFRRTDRQLRRCIEKSLKMLDEEVYRSQHRLLMMVGKNPNCSQNELAAALDISPVAVAVSLGKLEKGGYIKRETNLDDHRSNQVAITEKGNQLICKSIKLFDKVECKMFDGFTEEELERFHELMKKAYGNLDKMLQNGGEER